MTTSRLGVQINQRHTYDKSVYRKCIYQMRETTLINPQSPYIKSLPKLYTRICSMRRSRVYIYKEYVIPSSIFYFNFIPSSIRIWYMRGVDTYTVNLCIQWQKHMNVRGNGVVFDVLSFFMC